MKRLMIAAAAVLVLGGQALVAGPASAAALHHPKVTVKATHSSVKVGGTVLLTGKVGPNEHGHKVSLQLLSHGSWHTKSSKTLSKFSAFAFKIKPSHAGKYNYRVFDSAKQGWSAAKSRSVVITAHAAPSNGGSGGGGGSSTSCYPLTNGGNCYEPGEYCRDSDHGATGVAGDGESIQCEDNNGWRWEPR